MAYLIWLEIISICTDILIEKQQQTWAFTCSKTFFIIFIFLLVPFVHVQQNEEKQHEEKLEFIIWLLEMSDIRHFYKDPVS